MLRKNIVHYVYFCIIIFIITVPVLLLDTEPNKKSLLDNAYLPEFPEFKENADIQKELENYLNKRIGFRDKAVFCYEFALDKVFNKLEHSLYAYGENGYIMGNMDAYIQDYQHLNLQKDAEFVESFTGWLSKANLYLAEQNIDFLYFLAPDKKTIYYDCMSSNINVYGDVSRTDMVLEQVESMGVPYIYPKDVFIAAKEVKQIYNVKYDALHWNDLGNFLGNKLIDDYLQKLNDDILPLEEKQYNLQYECADRLAASYFYVYENIPRYYLKEERGIHNVSDEDKYKDIIVGDFEHYVNENLQEAPTILIFHDSYFADSAKFYKGRYGEVISVHNNNYWMLQELVEYYKPDIVLFENVERVFAGEFFSIETMNEWQAK